MKGQDGKSGVKYVRWGRTTCPSGVDIVYKGRRFLITIKMTWYTFQNLFLPGNETKTTKRFFF